MVPIEFTFYVIGFTVALIGFARGYARELGTTMIAMTAIFVLGLAETQLGSAQIDSVIRLISDQVLGSTTEESLNFLIYTIFSSAFLLIVFMGYAGETLEFPGDPAPPPQGTILSFFVSIINGYLIA